MKRKYYFENIIVTLPSKKRKIISITMKTKNEITPSDDEEIRSTFKRQKIANNSDSEFDDITTPESYDSDETIKDDESELENEGADVTQNNMIVSSEELMTDEAENQVTQQQNDKWDIIAQQLSQMNRYEKGEAMEEQIKDQLESYGFTVTKTQSTAKNGRIIGDNGIDHLAQIRINDKLIKIVIQSKNWKHETTGSVIRDLQGVLSNQYPERIGLIVLNNGGIQKRAENLAKNSSNTILIYNFNELKYLKDNLTKLQQQNQIRTLNQQYEEFENITLNERQGSNKRKIKAQKYRRYTTY